MDLLMALDDTMQVVDQSDQQKVAAETDRKRGRVRDARDFERDWSETHKRVKGQGKPCVSAKATKKAQKDATSRGQRVYPDHVPPGEIKQSELSKLCPPHGYIWTDHRLGGFQAHLKPFARISRRWATHGGCRAAAVLCLRHLWEKWCIVNSVPQAQCPMKDLWTCPLAADQPIPTGASSSSGGAASSSRQ